mgnify:CR=1 FL=1
MRVMGAELVSLPERPPMRSKARGRCRRSTKSSANDKHTDPKSSPLASSVPKRGGRPRLAERTSLGPKLSKAKAITPDAATQDKVRRAAKLGITAFNLEWDGHVQAMTGQRTFWAGVAPLKLQQPMVGVETE